MDGLSTATSNHHLSQSTTLPQLNQTTVSWNGKFELKKEENQRLFLESLIAKNERESNDETSRRNVRSVTGHDNKIRLTICGEGQDNEYLSVSLKSRNHDLSFGGLTSDGNKESTIYLDCPGSKPSGFNKLKKTDCSDITVKGRLTHGPTLWDYQAEEEIQIPCSNRQPFLEVGHKANQALFSTGCDWDGRSKCGSYNQFNPPEQSSCTIL